MNKNKSLSNFFLKINKSYKTPKTSTAILVGALLFLSGCADPDPFGAVSNATVNYYWRIGDFNISSDARVAVAVVDRRKEILNFEKDANFVGVVRDLFGKSFDVITQGGPLVDNIALSIDSGLYGAGIESEVLQGSSLSDTKQLRGELMHLKANRYVLVVVNNWRSNTYQRTELIYAVDLSVYIPDGTEILKKTFNGHKVGWDSGFVTPKERNATVLAKLYPETLKEMFENEEVSSALALAANEETVTSSNETAPIETEVAVVKDTTTPASAEMAVTSVDIGSGIDVSGIYTSSITGPPNYYIFKVHKRSTVTMKQNGNKIIGTFIGTFGLVGEIEGTIENDTIIFDWYGRSQQGKGKWKIEEDGKGMIGKWSQKGTSGGGKWDITKN